jgi:DNA-binding SARP family transcriptional activator
MSATRPRPPESTQESRDPPIEFRALGTIELLEPDGTALLSVVSRSKALSLFTYLVLSEGDGSRRRDEVCALLWPESDEARARNSLNQTLHSLKTTLGRETVTGGRETVGIDPERVRCDAVEFRQAIAASDWESALSLYGGDLLPGLYLPGATDFEDWLDRQRRDLQRLAFNAARRVAADRAEKGDSRGAIQALKRARTIRPDDDETVRDLMTACQRQGNVAAAIREYDAYRAWLDENFDLEPSEETRELVEQMRSANGNGHRAPVIRPAERWLRTGDLAEVATELDGRGRARPLLALGAAAVVLIGGVFLLSGAPGFITDHAGGTDVVTDPYRIAVLPLRPESRSDRAAAVVLGDRLDGWAELRQVEPNRIDARIAGEGIEAVGPEQGSVLAAGMGAGRFVTVRSEQSGPYLNVRAVLYESIASPVPLSRVDTTGAAADFSDDWYVDVLLRLFRDQNLGTTPDLRTAEWIAEPRAMFPYFSALARFSHGDGDSAMAYLQQAVGLDSTFGPAWNLLAGLAMTSVPMATDDWDTRDSLRALRDTALVYADLHFDEPESSVMGLARAKRLAELFPDSAGLQREVALLYQNAALERGFDHDSTLLYWERAYELEPFLDTTLFRLLVLHMERGRLDEARAIVRHAAAGGYEIPFCYFLCTFLDIVGASSINARDSILYAAEAERRYFVNWAVPKTLTMQDSISIPRHILATIDGAWYLAPNLELTAGRGSALPGLVFKESRRRHDRFRALANVPGLLEESPQVVSAVRDSLVAQGLRWVGPGKYYGHWTWQLYRQWLLGMLSVRLGQFDQAATWVDSMQQLAADSIPAEADSFFVHLGNDLPLEVQAASLTAKGDPEGALALLEQVHTGDELPVFADPVVGDDREGQPDLQQYIPWRRPFTRLMRANLLLELGRYEEAEGWYATFPWWIAPWDELLFLAPAFEGRARALDGLGRHQDALHYYRRFALRWKDADPHLQPRVEAARHRIRELEAEAAEVATP